MKKLNKILALSAIFASSSHIVFSADLEKQVVENKTEEKNIFSSMIERFWGTDCENLGISGQEGHCVKKEYCKKFVFWIPVNEFVKESPVDCPH